MTDSTIDVHGPVAAQAELTLRVAPVENRQQRRRQKRGLALSTVSVARENPALVSSPNRQVGGIGIVAERNRRASVVVISEGLLRIEMFRPEIVEPDNLQPFDLADAIPQHRDAVPFSGRDDLICDLGM